MAIEPSLGAGGALPSDPSLPGPFGVGRWADGFREFLRERPRVLLIGEITNFRRARAAAYFELRDANGGVPCSMWTSDLDKLGLRDGALRDGAEVIVAGGPDFYPGSATASPNFSFRVSYLRLAGEGDLLARLAALRGLLEADGLFAPQKALPRPAIPRTIGVVTARGSAACADLLAGLERRGWRGTIVWADAPVQDRRAAGAIATALRNLAAVPAVDVAVVCRGGGSLTDLWAFCDETLCRTVALLPVPVIASVGHHTDRTLIDDVAAVSCSTPTHAAEAAVPLHCAQAREALVPVDVGLAWDGLRAHARCAARTSAGAIGVRGRRLAELARGPARSIRQERARLHQLLRETRASAVRGVTERSQLAGRHGLVLNRKLESFENATLKGEAQRLQALALAERAHDPERTLERGYALVADEDGDPVTSAAAARAQERVAIRFADDAVPARIEDDDERQA